MRGRQLSIYHDWLAVDARTDDALAILVEKRPIIRSTVETKAAIVDITSLGKPQNVQKHF